MKIIKRIIKFPLLAFLTIILSLVWIFSTIIGILIETLSYLITDEWDIESLFDNYCKELIIKLWLKY